MDSRAWALGGAMALVGGLGGLVCAAEAAERRPVPPPAVALVLGWNGVDGRASAASTGVDAVRGGGVSVALLATWRPPVRGGVPWPEDDPGVEPLPAPWSPGRGALEAGRRAAQAAALRAEREALDAAPLPADPRAVVERALRRAEIDAWLTVLDAGSWRGLAAAEAGEGP